MVEAPDLLTVEEAARYLRIGRTNAYAMTREWRDSGGRSGLPVAEIGNVLRVPRRHLEQLIDLAPVRPEVPATATPAPQPAAELRPPPHGGASTVGDVTDQAPARPSPERTPSDVASPARTSRSRHRHAPAGQLDLFSPAAASSSRQR